jgi:hypothetical protein
VLPAGPQTGIEEVVGAVDVTRSVAGDEDRARAQRFAPSTCLSGVPFDVVRRLVITCGSPTDSRREDG